MSGTTVDTALPSAAPAERRQNSLLVAALLAAVAIVILVQQEALMVIEAELTAAVLTLFTYGGTNAVDSTVFIGIGSGRVSGLMITPMCSTVILLAPILFLAGLLQLFPRYRLAHVLKGLGLAVPIVVAANLGRYALVAYALQAWGRPGFELVHHWVGSVFVILCTAAAIVLLLVVATRGTVRAPRRGRHGA